MRSRETVVDLAVSRHLHGRRRHGRLLVQHEVECESGRRTLQGRVLDLSRTGALVCLSDPAYCARDDADLFAVAGRLACTYPDGFTIRFVAAKIQTRARIVRVARGARGLTVLGCDFGRPLEFHECRLLGIPPEKPQATGA
jgi:hypothetical protein